MSQKISYFVSGIIVAVLIGGLIYFAVPKKIETTKIRPNATTTPTNNISTAQVQYENTDYGFIFSLPDSWKGYSIILDEWEGYSLTETSSQGQVITEHGPLISIRHPDWDYKAPRQDIPIMVFTLKQWNDLQADKFHIGAAPIGPSEIGRNSGYVFAVPARYNYAFLTGYEEVDQILRENPLKTF